MPALKVKKNGEWVYSAFPAHTHKASEIEDLSSGAVNVSDTYDANSSEAMSGKAVAEALSTVEQVNPDWAQTDDTQPDYIKNKPAIPIVEGFATESYVDEKIREINVQGGVSGPVSWEDIEDKPFGEIVTQTDILPMGRFEEFTLNSTYNLYVYGVEGDYALTVGEEYRISWDGQEYSCEALDVSQMWNGLPVVAMGNGTAFGFPGNNEPFIIMCNNDNGFITLACMSHSEPCEYHDVRIYQEKTFLRQFDKKYIPSDISIPWNNINDRPFGETVGQIDLLPVTEYTDFTFESTYGVHRVAQIVDYVLVVGNTYTVSWDGKIYECVAQDASTLLSGYVALGNAAAWGLSGNSEPFVIGIGGGGAMYGSITDTEDGGTHSVGISEESIIVQKINEKYLPEIGALPTVTTSDAGKFLRVSADGTWIAETITNAEEASF